MQSAVIGAGAWGTALADRLARNGHDVRLWAYEPDVVTSINQDHTNRFLAGATLHERVRGEADIHAAVQGAELIVMAAPSHVTRAVAESMQPSVPKHAAVVVASKGIEQHTLALMTTVVESVFDAGPVIALSGPSFAAEVAQGQPTAIVAASTDHSRAEFVQQAFSGSTIRVYTQDDVTGVELGGSLKNVMAVATGVADGLGLGYNARAALITRGLAEMRRLGLALGAIPSTFAGLAGMGDLVLTCTGALSRNRAVGVAIGKGATLDQVLEGRETVAEGVITTRSARALAERHGVSMPIVEAVYGVLFDERSARETMTELMNRDLRAERDE